MNHYPPQKKGKEEILTEQVPILLFLPQIIRHKKRPQPLPWKDAVL